MGISSTYGPAVLAIVLLGAASGVAATEANATEAIADSQPIAEAAEAIADAADTATAEAVAATDSADGADATEDAAEDAR